jgi:hypothetical protein
MIFSLADTADESPLRHVRDRLAWRRMEAREAYFTLNPSGGMAFNATPNALSQVCTCVALSFANMWKVLGKICWLSQLAGKYAFGSSMHPRFISRNASAGCTNLDGRNGFDQP